MAKISQIIQAIEIFEKYVSDIKDNWFSADHEVIYIPVSMEPESMESKDLKKLEDLGIYFDEEFDGWYTYT